MMAFQAVTVRGLDWGIYTLDNNNDVLTSSIHGEVWGAELVS